MTVVEMKEKLIERINNLEDEKTLERLTWVIDIDDTPDGVYKLSDEEKAAVEDGRNQIRNGQWISHEDANKQIDEWLKE
jgi:hypothetical protein